MKNHMEFRRAGLASLAFGSATLLAALNACSRDQPPQSTVVVQSPPAAVQVVQAPAEVVMQDDYVYYPQYEVYYSSSRHQYGYRDGNAWAWRPEPAHVSLNVLLGSPSVRMEFHDSPERHHENVVRSYPHNWSPPGKGRDDRHEDHK
jgi:hypothetical protein